MSANNYIDEDDGYDEYLKEMSEQLPPEDDSKDGTWGFCDDYVPEEPDDGYDPLANLNVDDIPPEDDEEDYSYLIPVEEETPEQENPTMTEKKIDWLDEYQSEQPQDAPRGIAVHQAIEVKPEQPQPVTVSAATQPVTASTGKKTMDAAINALVTGAVDKLGRTATDEQLLQLFRQQSKIADQSLFDAAVKAYRGNTSTFTGKAKKKLIFQSSVDIAAEQLGEPDYIVDGIIAEGLGSIGAPPKTGKSWMMLDLAISVAKGTPWMGRKTTQGDVLYCAVEDGKRRIKKRLSLIGYPNGVDGLDFVEPKSLDTISGELIQQFDDWVCWKRQQGRTPRLIVIDTINRVKGETRGNNAYQVDTKLFSAVQEYSINNKITIMAVTHLKKQSGNYRPDDDFEMITGSMGLPGVCDVMMIITGKRFDDSKRLLITGRDLEQGNIEMSITFNKSNMHWQVAAVQTEQQRERKQYEENPIVKTVKRMMETESQWNVFAHDITEQSLDFGYGYPGIDRKVGRDLAQTIIEQLEEFDSIVTKSQKTNKGRIYTFSRK